MLHPATTLGVQNLYQHWDLLLTIWDCICGAGASSSGNFSLAHDPNDTRGRIGVNANHKNLVPGAPAPDTKTASKNAKRRQRAKVQHRDTPTLQEADCF